MNWLNLGILSLYFLLLFAVGELMYYKFRVNADLTRKWSHVGSGLLALLFPYYLNSTFEAALICGSFLILLSLSSHYGFLQSINAVQRKTYGSYLFPLAVYIAFAAFSISSRLIYFYLPVLVLAVSDTLAAVIGKHFPIKRSQNGKSLGGFLAFTLSAFLIAFFCLRCFHDSMSMIMLISPLLWAAGEWLSPKGTDNLSVPVLVILCLWLSRI